MLGEAKVLEGRFLSGGLYKALNPKSYRAIPADTGSDTDQGTDAEEGDGAATNIISALMAANIQHDTVAVDLPQSIKLSVRNPSDFGGRTFSRPLCRLRS